MTRDLKERYEQLGHEVVACAEIQTLRINTLKIEEKECVKRLQKKGVKLTKIAGIPTAYSFTTPFPIVSSEEYLLGYLYLQETASMLPALALLGGATPEMILDMCAAPGSKTTQLANLTNNSTPILALDVTAARLKKLEYNLERLGISSVATYRKDALYANDVVESCSHILLDAPCSGNYCIEDQFFEKRSLRDFKNRARLQKDLLRAAWQVLTPGGVLVYSTCSLEPEEDELVVQWFLDYFEDMELTEMNIPLGQPGATEVFGEKLSPDMSKTRKLWPDTDGTQGFFIARLQKKL